MENVAFLIRRYIIDRGGVSNDLLFECGKHLVKSGCGQYLSVGDYVGFFEEEFKRSCHKQYEIDDVDDSVKLRLV